MFKKGDLVRWSAHTPYNTAYLDDETWVDMCEGDMGTVVDKDPNLDRMDVFIWKARATASGFRNGSTSQDRWVKVDVQKG